MSSLNIRRGTGAPRVAGMTGRQSRRRYRFALTGAATVAAAMAIAVGQPVVGIAIYGALTLSFVFFS
ncbi:hypothetical protein [Paraburkholderia megapolitana]|uniref:Uncharacterized protein n=1 Tax=Paraburkholderia megapolitana TaxID=420953 RepID=A0A1I3PRJ1_9BURK|nr:hypothetical protein [Paraburkholderia megapolitana]QDQ80960.1 hypothetical protein FNZ07_07110 [Paraburkholderia megapolitana]SFJ23881.1 hypothetical protein SAMN05192543_10636 [Paraburkholderia megapolitana]